MMTEKWLSWLLTFMLFLYGLSFLLKLLMKKTSLSLLKHTEKQGWSVVGT